jgi:two-component system, NarL family, invasion response regulator UvrY
MAVARIILVEDYEPLQAIYKSLVEPEFEVVSILSDASRLLPQMSQTEAEIVLLDVSLSGKRGFEAAREIREYFPRAKIIFLTAEPSPEYVREALAMGASGYVSKISATADLVKAILAALDGKVFISPMLSRGESTRDY